MRRYLVFILCSVILAACLAANEGARQPTAVNEKAVWTSVASTLYIGLTQTAVLTPTPSVTPTATRKPYPTHPPLFPTPTVPPLVVVDGLRLAYIIDGNLYVQDSGKQPIQLTNSGEDSKPIFSDDGEEIIFFHKEEHHQNEYPKNKYSISIFSIKSDGSQLQELVTPGLLKQISPQYDEFSELGSSAFIPNTHHMLFNTHQAYHYDGRKAESGSNPNNDLFLADADSSQIKMLFPPGQGGHFGIAPNGRLFWLLTPEGQIQVVNLEGKTIRQNLATYNANWPEWPSPDIFWTDDSKQLSVIPISDPLAIPEPRTIWQYPIAGGSAIKILFNPPPMAFFFSISTDWNWIVYTYKDPALTDSSKFGIYIGDLRSGKARLIAKNDELLELPDYYSWSPDNKHYVIESLNGLMLGDRDGKIIKLPCKKILGWIDANHYLCGLTLGEIGKEELVQVIQRPTSTLYPSDITFIFLKR